MVIVRDGYMIWKGPGIDTRHELYSCTKIFTSTVMGVLITKGLIKAEDPAVNFFPGLAEGNDGQEAYKQIRFCDFATMMAGYNSISADCWDLHEKEKFDESYACTRLFTIPGRPKYSPRSFWRYNDQDVHMLGFILTKIAGRSLEQTFKDEVADKIGMSNLDWSDYGHRDGIFFNNPAGTPNNDTAITMNEVQGGIWTTPREFARLGLLYLNKGKWGNCQILDSSFVQKAISNQVPVSLPFINMDLTGRYGFYWWTNGIRKDSTRAWPSAPPRTAAAHGESMNFCFVIPEWNMVIIRMSPGLKDPIPAHGDTFLEGFFKILKEGITCHN
jgi:CubicO group peptidase (beta-lactamase class C family)